MALAIAGVLPAVARADTVTPATLFGENFEVRELAWGAEGLERAWILWEQHCDPWGPAGFGELRYRMPEPAGLGIAPSVLRFPDTEPGRPGPAMPVTVQAKSGPATLAASQIVGPDAGTFTIVADGCAGVRLEPMCGPGRDLAVAGAGDRTRGCERVRRLPA